MILDHRTYEVRHGHMSQYLENFEKYGLPVQLRHLEGYVGTFVADIGALNRVIHLWSYEDLADLERRRQAMAADPAWSDFVALNRGSFTRQETTILKPAAFSRLK